MFHLHERFFFPRFFCGQTGYAETGGRRATREEFRTNGIHSSMHFRDESQLITESCTHTRVRTHTHTYTFLNGCMSRSPHGLLCKRICKSMRTDIVPASANQHSYVSISPGKFAFASLSMRVGTFSIRSSSHRRPGLGTTVAAMQFARRRIE